MHDGYVRFILLSKLSENHSISECQMHILNVAATLKKIC